MLIVHVSNKHKNKGTVIETRDVVFFHPINNKLDRCIHNTIQYTATINEKPPTWAAFPE
jgi:hypothetical protein